MERRSLVPPSREPLLAVDSPIALAGALLLLLLCFALTYATAVVAGASLSPLVPLILGGLVALAVRPRSTLTPEDRQALWRWAAAVFAVDILIVIVTPYSDDGALLKQWPAAILVATAIAASRMANTRLALAFYAALGLFAGQFLLGMTVWRALLA